MTVGYSRKSASVNLRMIIVLMTWIDIGRQISSFSLDSHNVSETVRIVTLLNAESRLTTKYCLVLQVLKQRLRL